MEMVEGDHYLQQNRVAQFFRPMGLLDLLVSIGFLSFLFGLGPLFKGLGTNKIA
jgi:hypothetical protein